jgi:hypothetical protein
MRINTAKKWGERFRRMMRHRATHHAVNSAPTYAVARRKCRQPDRTTETK